MAPWALPNLKAASIKVDSFCSENPVPTDGTAPTMNWKQLTVEHKATSDSLKVALERAIGQVKLAKDVHGGS